jgi:RHS repeat-associated protein
LGSAGASPARAGAFAGSFEGAGGIGGLLARTAHASTSPYQPSTSAYYHADGNGNVTYLLNQDRSHGASYKYDPYGRLITSSGPLASANLMRFSSKPWHDHSASYYYGYRFYVPELQRWANRDPFGSPSSQFNAEMFGTDASVFYEEGIVDPELLPEGPNLYSYVGNNPVNLIDPSGEVVPIVVAIGVRIAAGVIIKTGVKYLTKKAAARAAAKGADVLCKNRATAKNVAQQAGKGQKPIGPEKHGPSPDYRPHYHNGDRTSGHVFY